MRLLFCHVRLIHIFFFELTVSLYNYFLGYTDPQIQHSRKKKKLQNFMFILYTATKKNFLIDSSNFYFNYSETNSYFVPKSGLELAFFTPWTLKCFLIGEANTPSPIPRFNSNCLYFQSCM